MKKIQYVLILLLVSSEILHAQLIPDVDIRGNSKLPYTDKPIIDNNFQFAMVSDRTGGHRMGVFRNAMFKVNRIQPEFVLSVGDLIEGYTEDKEEIEKQWNEIDEMVNSLDSRFFYVAGNHDFSNQTMADVWKNRLGPDYYSFKYKNTLFLCLNSEDGILGPGLAALGDEQFEYFRDILNKNQDVQWTFVMMHQPMWTYDNTGRWPELMELLAKRKHTTFAGHVHQYTHFERNNSDYIILGTTGGISGMKGLAFGEEDHITWITVSDDHEPIITNLMLDGIEDEKFVTEASAELFKGFTQNPAVFFEPKYILKDDKISEMTLIVKNTQSSDLKVKMDARAHNSLIPEKTQIDLVVPSNSTKTINIPIREIQKVNLNDLNNPLVFEAECSFDAPQPPYQKWKQEVKFFPNKKYALPKAENPITLDGELKEWKELSHSVKDTASNISFAVDARYTKEGVYFGVNVKNHFPQNSGNVSFGNTEGITLYVDANEKEKSAFNSNDIGALLKGQYMVLIIAPTGDTGEILSKETLKNMFKSNRLFKDKNVNFDGYYQRNEEGYSAEFIIPNEILETLQDKDWKTIRLNVILTYKTKDGKASKLSWQPTWDQLVPGTGMFFKE